VSLTPVVTAKRTRPSLTPLLTVGGQPTVREGCQGPSLSEVAFCYQVCRHGCVRTSRGRCHRRRLLLGVYYECKLIAAVAWLSEDVNLSAAEDGCVGSAGGYCIRTVVCLNRQIMLPASAGRKRPPVKGAVGRIRMSSLQCYEKLVRELAHP